MPGHPYRSARVSGGPAVVSSPTVKQELVMGQETPRRRLLPVPLFGLGTTDHVVPLQDSTRLCSVEVVLT